MGARRGRLAAAAAAAAVAGALMPAQTAGQWLCPLGTANSVVDVRVPWMLNTSLEEFAEGVRSPWLFSETNVPEYYPGNLTELARRHVPELRQVGHNRFAVLSPHEMDWDPATLHVMQDVLVLTDDAEILFYGWTTCEDGLNMIERIYVEFEAELPHGTRLHAVTTCNLHGSWIGEPLLTIDSATWNATQGTLGETSECSASEQGGGLIVDLGDGASVSLGLLDEAGAPVSSDEVNATALQINMTFAAGQFLGIGFGEAMTPTDMVICYEQAGNVWCGDYIATNRIRGPDRDVDVGGENDVEMVDSRVENGVVTAVAVRALKAQADDTDTVIQTTPGEAQRMIHARGTFKPAEEEGARGSLSYHGTDTRGYMEVALRSQGAFSQCNTQPREVRDLQLVHGVTMFLLWAILILVGAIIARYERHTDWWLGAHRALQSVGTVITIPGFYLTFQWETSGGTAHTYLGYTVLLSSWAQAAVGATMYRTYKVTVHLLRAVRADENETKLSEEARYKLLSYTDQDDESHFLHDYLQDRANVEPYLRDEIDAFVDTYFASLGIPLLPPTAVRWVCVYARLNFGKPFHRWMGRILPFVALGQIYIGATLVKAHVAVNNMFIGWVCVVMLVIIYKEIELQFALPRSPFAKLQLLLCCCCSKQRSEVQRGSSGGDDKGLEESASSPVGGLSRSSSEVVYDVPSLLLSEPSDGHGGGVASDSAGGQGDAGPGASAALATDAAAPGDKSLGRVTST